MPAGWFDATLVPAGWFDADTAGAGAWFDRTLIDSDGPAPPPVVPPNAYARMMAALLPPGKVWRLIGASITAALLAGCADELGRLEARTTDLLNEAIPSTTIELLPEYESELALPSTGTNAQRQARIVARLIARQRYRPVDFQNALAPLLAQLPGAVVVIETSHAQAVSMRDVREIYRFFIYRDPALPNTYDLASAQTLVDQIKPSHTRGYAIERLSLIVDEPHSICNRDIVGT